MSEALADNWGILSSRFWTKIMIRCGRRSSRMALENKKKVRHHFQPASGKTPPVEMRPGHSTVYGKKTGSA